MNDERFHSLERAIIDPLFPLLDLRLRAGGHIDSDEIAAYEYLEQAAEWLESFYEGYDCRLVHGTEGFWYLLSEGDLLGHRRLSVAEMLVGQVLALIRMDPAWLSDTGWVPRSKVLEALEHLLGRERLAALLAPRSRVREHHADDRKIRDAVDKALNGLESLGFVQQRRETAELIPRRSLMRFVAPVRDAGDPRAALERLVQQGEIELGDDTADGDEADGPLVSDDEDDDDQ